MTDTDKESVTRFVAQYRDGAAGCHMEFDDAQAFAADLEALLAKCEALEAELAEARVPVVKPLEWDQTGYGRWETGYLESGGRGYLIRFGDEKYQTTYGMLNIGNSEKTLEAAKEAAQADYERRILTAINMQPLTVQQAARRLLEAGIPEIAISMASLPLNAESDLEPSAWSSRDEIKAAILSALTAIAEANGREGGE